MELTSVRYEYGGERKVGVSRRELAVCGTGGAHGVLERGEGSERAYWCGIVRVGSCVWDRTESGVSARTGVRRVLVYGAYWCTARRRGSGARTGEERGWGCGLEGWGCGLEGRAGRAGKWVWVGSAGAEDEAARERRVELGCGEEKSYLGKKRNEFI